MMPGTDDLKARRESQVGQSDGKGCGGMAREVKGVCECHGAEQGDRFPVNFGGRRSLGRKCLGGHGGGQQKVEIVETPPEDPVQGGSEFLNVKMVMNEKAFCTVQGLGEGSTQFRSDSFQILMQLSA